MRIFFVFAITVALLIYSTGLWAPYHLDDQNVVKIAEEGSGWSTRPLGFASFWFSRQVLLVLGSILPWRDAGWTVSGEPDSFRRSRGDPVR